MYFINWRICSIHMIKNLITNSSQERDLLLKQNGRHSVVHSSIYQKHNYQFVSILTYLIFLKVALPSVWGIEDIFFP